MKKTTTQRTSSRPHIKWGALVGSLAILVIAISLIVLNLAKASFSFLAVAVCIAYGPIISIFLFILSFILILEDFIPSFIKYKNYKKKVAYMKSVKATVRSSIRSNLKKDSATFNEFLKENPKYRI